MILYSAQEVHVVSDQNIKIHVFPFVATLIWFQVWVAVSCVAVRCLTSSQLGLC